MAVPGFFSMGVSSGETRNLSWGQIKNNNQFFFSYSTSILDTLYNNLK